MRFSHLSAALALVLCLVSGAMAQEAVKFYKYKVDDVNWLPVFRSEMQSLSDNNGTGYAVTFNEKGQYVDVEHVVHGRGLGAQTYAYGADGKVAEDREYAVADGERLLKRTSVYEWKGDGVQAVHCTADGKLQSDWRREESRGDVSFVQYFPDGSKGQSNTVLDAEDGILIENKWQMNSKKYYREEIDPATGQITDSRCYYKGKYDHRKEHRYNAEGVLAKVDLIDPKGHRFCEKTFDERGHLIEAAYRYRDKTSERYRWTRDERGAKQRLEVDHNGKPAYTVTFIRNDSGNIEMSEVYDAGGELFARYPGHVVQYLDRDGKPESGSKGTILKKGRLW